MDKKVIVYSTPSCVYCKMVKKYFSDNGINFVEKDVASDIEAQEEMLKKTGQLAVPVVDIDGEIVVGFDRSKIASLLNI